MIKVSYTDNVKNGNENFSIKNGNRDGNRMRLKTENKQLHLFSTEQEKKCIN